MTDIHYAGQDFWLTSSDIPADLDEALRECGVPGRNADPYVDQVLERWAITGNESDCAKYLYGYGAWEDDELEDHQHNLRRLVWLTGCDLVEHNEAYFYTY